MRKIFIGVLASMCVAGVIGCAIDENPEASVESEDPASSPLTVNGEPSDDPSADSGPQPDGPAAVDDCKFVLEASGYEITVVRASACIFGALPFSTAKPACDITLFNTGVVALIAAAACAAA
jgi:hypothetical protein